MVIWLITLMALWVNPIVGLIFYFFTRKRAAVRKAFLLFFLLITLIELIAIILGISFASKVADFLYTAIFYLGICFSIWWLAFQKKLFVRVPGIILAVIIFGVNYLSGTVGVLGVGFIINDWDPEQVIELPDNLIYKETVLGNAASDFRGKHVEIFKRIGFLPVERKVVERKYFNQRVIYLNSLDVKYDPVSHMIHLKVVDTLKGDEIQCWSDSLYLYNVDKQSTNNLNSRLID